MGDGGQLDLFTITAIDPPWRDNRDAMGYPFLSLQKRRTTPIKYGDGNVWLSVHAPAEFGIATIWDWDVMIFAASHINEAIESRRKISPRIAFVPHDCLKQIGRPIGGRPYHLLADAIRRLYATMVITNIRQADQPERGRERPFHWLTDYALPKKYGRCVYTTSDSITHITPEEGEKSTPRGRGRSSYTPGSTTPSFGRATSSPSTLTTSSLPAAWSAGCTGWRARRSGVTRDLRHFACDIRAIAETQPLPEYGV